MMRRAVLSIAALLGACSSGPTADLPSLEAVRSAANEWALVNAEAARRRVTATYADGMRQDARDQIDKEAATLAKHRSPGAAAAAALEAMPDDAAPTAIRRHAAALQQIEDALEPA